MTGSDGSRGSALGSSSSKESGARKRCAAGYERLFVLEVQAHQNAMRFSRLFHADVGADRLPFFASCSEPLDSRLAEVQKHVSARFHQIACPVTVIVLLRKGLIGKEREWIPGARPLAAGCLVAQPRNGASLRIDPKDKIQSRSVAPAGWWECGRVGPDRLQILDRSLGFFSRGVSGNVATPSIRSCRFSSQLNSTTL